MTYKESKNTFFTLFLGLLNLFRAGVGWGGGASVLPAYRLLFGAILAAHAVVLCERCTPPPFPGGRVVAVDAGCGDHPDTFHLIRGSEIYSIWNWDSEGKGKQENGNFLTSITKIYLCKKTHGKKRLIRKVFPQPAVGMHNCMAAADSVVVLF